MFATPAKYKHFYPKIFLYPLWHTSPPLCPLEAVIYVAPPFKGGEGRRGKRARGRRIMGNFTEMEEKNVTDNNQ
jgi:hypothetical protein